MRPSFALAIALLSLAGCDIPPSGPAYGYTQPGYPPPDAYDYPSAPPPGLYGYAPPPYDPYAVPGYSYNGGVPTIIEGGASVPLVFFGGHWGYYDHEHHWHHAPDHVSRDLEHRQGGGPFHAGPSPAGAPPPHADWHPPAQPHAGWHPPPGSAPAGYRPPQPPQPMPPPNAGQRPMPQPPAGHEQHRACPPGQRC